MLNTVFVGNVLRLGQLPPDQRDDLDARNVLDAVEVLDAKCTRASDGDL